MDKLGNKLAKLLVVPAASFVMALTVYAAAPTFDIDFEKENVAITAVTTATTPVEYSLNKTTWTPLLGHTIDVSTLMGKSIYVREIGKTSVADMVTIAVPRRPAAPTDIAFTPTTTSPTGDKISALATHQFQVDNLGWQIGVIGGVAVGEAEKLGATFSVRTIADDDADKFASLPKTVTVAKRAAAPDVRYDETKDSILAKTGLEYKNTKAGTSWTAVGSSDITINRLHAAYTTGIEILSENGEDKKFIYFRVKGTAGTSGKAASDVIRVQFPDAQTVAPIGIMDIDNEKITDVNNTMEYRVLTTSQGASESYTTPAWTPVTGTEINLANAFSPSGTTDADILKSFVQVRYKAVPKTNVAVAKPASTEQEFKIAARPGKPTNVADATGVIFNYTTFGSESINVAVTNQYKIGTGQWTTGTGALVSIVDQIPSTGKLDLVLRVKAVKSGTTPPVYTPASVELKNSFLAIAARPKTPTAKFTSYSLTKNEISGVTTKMEYMDPDANANGGGADVDGYAVVPSAPLPLEGTLGTTRDVTVRVKAVGYTASQTMPVPASEEQVITCEFLPKVSEISGTMVFTPKTLTGVDASEIGTVSFPNYSFTGTKADNADITYTLGTLPVALDGLVDITDGGTTVGTADTALLVAADAIPGGVYTVPVIVTYTDDLVSGTAVQYTDNIAFVITNPIAATTITLTEPAAAGATTAVATVTGNCTVESTTWSGNAGANWAVNDIPKAVIVLKADAYNAFPAAADITVTGPDGTPTVTKVVSTPNVAENTLTLTLTYAKITS